MNKKVLTILIIVGIALVGALVFLGIRLSQANKTNEEMVQLFELEKQEMEDEYSTFATQYDEMIASWHSLSARSYAPSAFSKSYVPPKPAMRPRLPV